MRILRKILLRIYPRIIRTYYQIYNRLLLSFLDVEIGINPIIFNKVYFRIASGGKLTIGDNFIFTSGGGTNPLCRNIRGQIFIDRNARIIIGNNSGISSGCLWAKEKIVIGDGVNIGGNTLRMFCDLAHVDIDV